MLTLLKNAHVFAPEALGLCDVLICDGRIAQIDTCIDISSSILDCIDLQGQLLVPGFVDTLVHITGGGGEGGFNTRTPELQLADAVRAGVTTLVGGLGTDATTRGSSDLYGKAKQLCADGLTCLMYTGSYETPVKTITGTVRGDLVFIDPVIGVGELAIADHRGSQPSAHELARIAADAHVGGLLSGKSGIVSIHVGAGKQQLQLLYEVARDHNVALSRFYPTHMNRDHSLLDAGIEFVKAGGYIDFTTSTNAQLLELGELRASRCLAIALHNGADASRLTMSSDAQGSLPHFNSKGDLDGLDIGSIASLHDELVRSVRDEKIDLALALATITRNPATIIGAQRKGRIALGMDADLNILDKDTLTLRSTMAQGRWLMRDNQMLARTPFDY